VAPVAPTPSPAPAALELSDADCSEVALFPPLVVAGAFVQPAASAAPAMARAIKTTKRERADAAGNMEPTLPQAHHT
jgi:hypothetical protein